MIAPCGDVDLDGLRSAGMIDAPALVLLPRAERVAWLVSAIVLSVGARILTVAIGGARALGPTRRCA